MAIREAWKDQRGWERVRGRKGGTESPEGVGKEGGLREREESEGERGK